MRSPHLAAPSATPSHPSTPGRNGGRSSISEILAREYRPPVRLSPEGPDPAERYVAIPASEVALCDRLEMRVPQTPESSAGPPLG